jgi:hypothetical protein
MVIVVEKVADIGVVDAARRVRSYGAGLRPPAGHDSSSHTREGVTPRSASQIWPGSPTSSVIWPTRT